MRLVVLQFLAGFFGALSSVFLLGSLGSDYWLMASESCGDAAHFKLWRVTKVCVPAYLSHAPVSGLPNSVLTSDSATVQRAFWCVIFVLGVILVMIGGFVTICATPGTSHRLYETGGAFFITGGILIMSVVMLFAVWVQVSDSLERYGLQRRRLVCPSLQLSVHYGPSFMLAPTAAFLCLLTGLLLLLIPSVRRASARECKDTENQPLSLREECV
ncbi:transmembrane protein 182-like [Labeo rohita]|uniref:Transmembrane protein 182 n=1 Tax=Labeo rohita TaxID=84645 RepID=A0A498NNH1_LABRO|nr:transmembrane protein 182-like [Labeo rohita]